MSVRSPKAARLARHNSECRLCHEPIIAGESAIRSLDRIGWVHAGCALGYVVTLAEHGDDMFDNTTNKEDHDG